LESPRQLQEQFNRRLYDIGSTDELAKAKFADFLGKFTMEEMLVITLDSAPAESGCLKPWTAVFLQEDRSMAFTGKETAENSDQHVVIAARAEALACEHLCEKASAPRSTPPLTFVYQTEVSDFMEPIKNGR
jgi:hypothetical protein